MSSQIHQIIQNLVKLLQFDQIQNISIQDMSVFWNRKDKLF